MIISIINDTDGKLLDTDLLTAIRAINRQIDQDFAPYWGYDAQLRLEGSGRRQPNKIDAHDMRADAVLYIRHQPIDRTSHGYHNHTRGIPFGEVFLEVPGESPQPWSVSLSHEVLELIADPEANMFVQGPHPEEPNRNVFFWYEVCDAVQADWYSIDGVQVSNFVLPLYFTAGDEKDGRNDFLGTRVRGKTLRSFGVNPGGYMGYFDPKKGINDILPREDVTPARQRLALKQSMGVGRAVTRGKRSRL